MRHALAGCGDVAPVEILSRIQTGDLQGQLNFRVDVDAVVDTFAEGELPGESDGVAGEDEALTNIAGERCTGVFKHRRDHEVVDLVGAEVELHTVAVAPDLDVAARDTGKHRVERVVEVLHLQLGLDVFSIHSNNTPINSNWNVQDEIGFEGVNEGRVVHGEHGRFDITVVDDVDVRAVGPGGLVAWEVPDGHVVGGLVKIDLEEVHISPSVVVAGLKDEVVGVAGVHGLVPCAIPLKFVGVQEATSL